MAKGISMHVGVDTQGKRADAFARDARAMAELAGGFGYEVLPPLLGDRAHIDEVRGVLRRAVPRIEKGDTLLLTFSTHGKSNQAKSEHLSLPGGILTDRELYGDFLCQLGEGTRAVLVADACASQGFGNPNTILERLRWARSSRRNEKWRAIRRVVERLPCLVPVSTFGGGMRPVEDLKAEVHELSAAEKGENAATGPMCGGMGCFTFHLVEEMRSPRPPRSYDALVAGLGERLAARGQTPRYTPYGPVRRQEAAPPVPFAI